MAFAELAGLPALAACAALLVGSMAAQAQDLARPQAVEQLAREKTLAEACASILKTFVGDAPMARVQGERLYARAQAEMDGLVRLIVADLASEGSPAERPELRPKGPANRRVRSPTWRSGSGRRIARQTPRRARPSLRGSKRSAGCPTRRFLRHSRSPSRSSCPRQRRRSPRLAEPAWIGARYRATGPAPLPRPPRSPPRRPRGRHHEG
jgi:hypothetical protein